MESSFISRSSYPKDQSIPTGKQGKNNFDPLRILKLIFIYLFFYESLQQPEPILYHVTANFVVVNFVTEGLFEDISKLIHIQGPKIMVEVK